MPVIVRRRRIHAAAWLAACALCLPVAAQDGEQPAIKVWQQPLYPGDVARITVSPAVPLDSLRGSAFGRPLVFWPAPDGGGWHGLLGVGLTTTPGSYDLTVTGSPSAGPTWRGKATLTIQDKRFETRRLRVDSRFVDPPAAEVARIQREAKLLDAIFSASASPRLWRGSFVMPVAGQPTSSFGRLSVFNGEPRGRHQGADFAAPTGTPVHAPNAGRIALAADLYFSGNTVIVDHGAGLYSLFAHLSRIAVKEGAVVPRGALLGEVGATGRVTGPHLHWAVRLGGVSVDPVSLMRAVGDFDEADPAGPLEERAAAGGRANR